MYHDSSDHIHGCSIERNDMIWLAERFGNNRRDIRLTNEFAVEIFHRWAIHFQVEDYVIWDRIHMFHTNLSISATSPIVDEMVSRTIYRPCHDSPRRIKGRPLPEPWDSLIDKPYYIEDFQEPPYPSGNKKHHDRYQGRRLFDF